MKIDCRKFPLVKHFRLSNKWVSWLTRTHDVDSENLFHDIYTLGAIKISLTFGIHKKRWHSWTFYQNLSILTFSFFFIRIAFILPELLTPTNSKGIEIDFVCEALSSLSVVSHAHVPYEVSDPRLNILSPKFATNVCDIKSEGVASQA